MLGEDPLKQPLSIVDDRELGRLIRLMDKASTYWTLKPLQEERKAKKWAKIDAKMNRMQLQHFAKTGRWLLGVPPVEGWFPDPARRFKSRLFENDKWTAHVRDDGGREHIDPPVGPVPNT